MSNKLLSLWNSSCQENVMIIAYFYLTQTLGYETLEELPHHDTINNFLCNLKPKEIEKIRDYMIKQLFKKRSLVCLFSL